MNKFDFNNRTALITGGAQGFGLDIAKKFIDFGAKVIIWDIDEQQLEIASKEIEYWKIVGEQQTSQNLKKENSTPRKIMNMSDKIELCQKI